MMDLITVKGKPLVCIFLNDTNNYGIYKVKLVDNSTITMKGKIGYIEINRFYDFVGNYVDDPNYGIQFDVKTLSESLPDHEEGVIRFLSGPNFPGIGKKTASKIVDKYGIDVIDKIKSDADFTIEIKGLKQDKVATLLNLIRKANNETQIYNELISYGFSEQQIKILNSQYDNQVIDILKQNPYQPLYEVSGIGFQTLDKIAMNLGFDTQSLYRKEAVALEYYKRHVFNEGHSYINADDYLHSLNPILIEGYEALIQRGELILEDEKLYHHTQYDSELYVSDYINSFYNNTNEFEIENIESILEDVCESVDVMFDDSQKEAIKSLLNYDINIVTGGPGTGKSTLLSGFVALLQKQRPWLKIALLAPTGRAAKRLESLTGVYATTIHSFLRWNLDDNTFGYNVENPVDVDVLIIDEFSMVDIWLLACILKGTRKVKKIIFVGDKDQLPSVSPGNVLSDLLNVPMINTLILKRNYRQEKGSEVIDLATTINNGNYQQETFGNEVFINEIPDNQIKYKVNEIYQYYLTKGYSIYDIQVLAPMYKGSAGIDILNRYLQDILNPVDKNKNEIIHGHRVFREGDKILQLKNQPDDLIYNGDIGELVKIEGDEVAVLYDENLVYYTKTQLINITHAYAISVHKSQGSEYPVVVLVASLQFNRMLSRKLYYTGITRSSKYLHIIGQQEALLKAMKNNFEVKRITYLKERLTKG